MFSRRRFWTVAHNQPAGPHSAVDSAPARSWPGRGLSARSVVAGVDARGAAHARAPVAPGGGRGGAGRGRRLLLSAFGSRVLSRPLRQKSFCPREFPFNTGKRSLLAFSNVPSPPGPLRAPPPRWLSPPLSSSSSVSLSVPRLPSGSRRLGFLPPSAPTPCPGARRVRAGPACRAAAHPGSYGRLPGPFHGAPFAAMFFLSRAENVLLGLRRRICVARRVPSSVPPR